jgi:ribosomal protein S5
MAVKVSLSNNMSDNPHFLKDLLGVSLDSFCKSKIAKKPFNKKNSNNTGFKLNRTLTTKERLIKNLLPAARKTLFISPIKRSVVVSRVGNVSRTTKGGRRRQVSAHGVEVGHGSWVSYTAKVKAKSTQRFMAFEKISCPETSKIQRARLLEMMRTSPKSGNRFYKKNSSKLSVSNFDQKLSAANVTFFNKDTDSHLPTKPMTTSFKGTKTVIGFGSYRCDNKAESVQYSLLSLLGVKNSFVKNHGSKNGIVRVSNMITSLKNIYPTVDRVRMYGVDPLRLS